MTILTQFGSELYLGTLRSGAHTVSGMYGAEAREAQNEDVAAPSPSDMAERLVLLGVSTPGASQWVQQLQAGSDVDSVTSSLDALDLANTTAALPGADRRPVAEQPGLAVVLKLADLDRAEQIRTTEVVDVVGILDVAMLPSSDLPIGETDASSIPTWPCIHVLFYDRTTPTTSVLPLLKQPTERVDDVRSSLVAFLAEQLGGDTLAAEFLFLAMLAKMYVVCAYPDTSVGLAWQSAPCR